MELGTIFTLDEYSLGYKYATENGYTIEEIESTEKETTELETYFEDEEIEVVIQEAVYDDEGNIISEEIREKQLQPLEKTREVKKNILIRQFKIVEIPQPTETELAQQRIAELKSKLQETDYVVIKIAEGEATQEEYAEVLANRKAWRVEINELQA